jgi:HlyD family secretion protein
MRKGRIAWIVTLLVLVGGGLALWRYLGDDGDGAVVYQTAPVARGRLAAQVTASGTLSPLVTVQVGSQVSGRIKALHADFNSRVDKGQVIAEIDPQLFDSDVAKARANLTAANANVSGAVAEADEAKRHWERTQALVAQGLVSSAESEAAQAAYQTAKARVTTARASLAQARAALSQSETNKAYTTIHSPISGIVISRNVDVGQTVAASLQAPTLFTIAEDLKKMEVHTSVAESDVGRLAPGMPVEFGVDAYPSERFKAKVKEVRYSPQTVQNVVTYDAVVSVENPDLKLRPGMTADVTFKIEERDNALLVPNAALRFRPPDAAPPTPGPGGRPERGKRAVWILDPLGAPQEVSIKVGISDGRNTEVTEGDLPEGAQVITGIEGAEPAAQPPPGGAPGGRRGGFGRIL